MAQPRLSGKMRFAFTRRSKLLVTLAALVAIGLTVNALTAPSTPGAITSSNDRVSTAPNSLPPSTISTQTRTGPAGPEKTESAPTNQFDGTGKPTAAGPESDPSVAAETRLVIFTANLAVEVKEVRSAMDRVSDIALRMGGFVAGSSVSAFDISRSVSITIRVPRDRFSEALTAIEALGEVKQRLTRSDDVTEEYVDLKAQLENLKKQEQRLQELYARATTIDDILKVQRELERVRGEIDRLTGRLNFLDRNVELSTITVTLTEAQPPERPLSATISLELADVKSTVAQLKDIAHLSGGFIITSETRVFDQTEVATVSLQVPEEKFNDAVAAIQRLGKVKELVSLSSEKPQITVNLRQPEKPPEVPGVNWLEPLTTGVTYLFTVVRGVVIFFLTVLPLIAVGVPVYVVYRYRSSRQNRKASPASSGG